jgi:hypothetical protein
MYKQDVETAKVIANLQRTYKYPTILALSSVTALERVALLKRVLTQTI